MFWKTGTLSGTECDPARENTFCGHREEMPQTSLPVTEIIQLTGPMTVQMACSWQPPLNPSAQGFTGRHVKPSPLYPLWQLQKTFTPSCVHSAALWHPPLFCLQRSAAAWGKENRGVKSAFKEDGLHRDKARHAKNTTTLVWGKNLSFLRHS